MGSELSPSSTKYQNIIEKIGNHLQENVDMQLIESKVG